MDIMAEVRGKEWGEVVLASFQPASRRKMRRKKCWDCLERRVALIKVSSTRWRTHECFSGASVAGSWTARRWEDAFVRVEGEAPENKHIGAEEVKEVGAEVGEEPCREASIMDAGEA